MSRASEQINIGQRSEAEGDYVAAAAAYRAMIAASDPRVAAEGYFLLGRVCWRQGRLEAALAAYESAAASAERLHDTELHARISNGMGAAHYARGDHDAARTAYAAAEAKTTDLTLQGKVLLNLGVIESAEGNHEEARDFYHSAYLLFEESGDSQSATLALHNRGMVEADLGLWHEADESFRAALGLAAATDDREMLARTLVNRSETLVELESFAEAIDHCDRALAIYADIGDEVGRGESLRWRAHALGRSGNLVWAERNAAEALNIAMRAGARLLEAQSARDLGVLRGLMGDRAGGAKELRRALALFTSLGARKEATEVGAMIQRPTPNRSLRRIEDLENPD
ncbi:MAG: metal dependent phosphohydrolase [Gemmatimonadetes bacterium]|nr:metal dependent phosphohydrolase [Gemmatimonadota bacterium]